MAAPSETILYPISAGSNNILIDEDLNVASFQGLDGVIGSLVIMKWNQIANMGSQEVLQEYLCDFLQAMDVPAVSLHCYQEILSIAIIFKPCNIISLLFCQHERKGRWRRWWLEEVIKAKECGLKTGDDKLKNESELPQLNDQHLNGVPYAIDNLPWLVVLFNLWCQIFQDMNESHAELAEGQMVGTDGKIKLGKFRLDGDHTWNMQSKSCSLDSSLSSIFSNTTPAYPSNTPPPPPKGSTLMMTCT